MHLDSMIAEALRNPLMGAAVLRDIELVESRRACEESFAEFVRQAWHVVEPGIPYLHSWHIDVLCEHLEAVTDGDITRLLINIPPRTAKSTIVSVLWPCWEWIHSPVEKYLCASYSGILSTRDNLKARRLITSSWYQTRWPHARLAGDQNQKTRFENDQTGYRIATSVGGTATGEGGSRILIDDPLSASDAQSDQIRQSAIEWFSQTMTTRLNDPRHDAIVIIMQRLHEMDHSGYVLKRGGYEHVCLPMEYDGKKRTTVLGAYDQRTKVGELLAPNRFGRKEVDNLKIDLGEYGTAGQLQQQPSPAGGGIIDTKKFKLWPHDRPLPPFLFIVQAYDTAFTEKTMNDPTAGQAWGVFEHKGRRGALLLDSWTDYLKYPALRTRVLDEWQTWYGRNDAATGQKERRADLVLIENKGSGIALVNDLSGANIMARAYDLPRGQRAELSKVARAHLIAPIVDADYVFILESGKKGNEGNPVIWAKELIHQCELFPNAEHDDLVDDFTMTMYYLKEHHWFDLPSAPDEEPEDIDYAAQKKAHANPYAM